MTPALPVVMAAGTMMTGWSAASTTATVTVRVAVPLSFTTVSGSLKFADAAGKLSFHTTSGDISGTIKSSGDLEAHSVSGKIALDTLTIPQKGAFSLDTVSGDLALTFPAGTKASTSFHSVSGSQKNNIINDPAAAFKITAKTTSGDLTINSK